MRARWMPVEWQVENWPHCPKNSTGKTDTKIIIHTGVKMEGKGRRADLVPGFGRMDKAGHLLLFFCFCAGEERERKRER